MFNYLSKWKWCTDTSKYNRNGYAVRTSGGYGSMHRMIMKAPKGTIVDHINGDKLDNRKVNLRFVTASENALNHKNVNALKPVDKRRLVCGFFDA